MHGVRKSLKFLSIDGLYKALTGEKRNIAYPQFSDHYFTGEYPVKPIDELGDNKITQLSLLNTVFSIIVRFEVVILYYSLHINRVFSRYTLTEIQIMTSSNVSLLHFLSVTIFVCLIPIIVQIVFYY